MHLEGIQFTLQALVAPQLRLMLSHTENGAKLPHNG